ncbi:MAG: 6-phosphogluconolactonase [Chitinivibrionales bacterium]|nr:6-phosphogluconolactonase [Chitinivibrionales bacterium]MBD3356555.1 6-phosphogluconolactonase [Chitinivibrionales bacterium]
MEGKSMERRDIQPPQMLIAGSAGAHARVAAIRIVDEIKDALSEKGYCTLFLSGGATPRPVYKEMARPQTSKTVDWTKVQFYFVDERCVPPDHPESNYRMAAEEFLSPIHAAAEQIHRIRGESSDPESEATRYAGELPTGDIDIMILGIGAEGHTASLFPDSKALNEVQRPAAAVIVPASPSRRITITPPVIKRARQRIVLASGVSKAGIIARAIRGRYMPNVLPVQFALPGLWILDADAASELRIETDQELL